MSNMIVFVLIALPSSLAVMYLFGSCEQAVDSDAGRFPPDNREKVTIAQGAWGNVRWWQGDFMPTTDPDGPSGRITPAIRWVFVHELTSMQQVDQVSYSPFYRAIYTTPVDSVQSDGTGFFQFTLAPGRYSFFVREDSLYYANDFDGSGNILPVTVVADSLAYVQIDITYRATF